MSTAGLQGSDDIPLFFIANDGQTSSLARYMIKMPGLTAFFTPQATLFQTREAAIRVQFIGAKPNVQIDGTRPLGSRANFLIGADSAQWRVGIPTYAEIAYRGLYRGIDMRYSAKSKHLKSEFIVAPHINPATIRLRYTGADRVEIDSEGALVLVTGTGHIRELAPEIFQDIGGRRVRITGEYQLSPEGEVSFRIGPYDNRYTLVIDPNLAYSTYLGGSAFDSATAVAVDNVGNAYVTGWTESTDFPLRNAIQNGQGGSVDAFVVKLSPGGNSLVYATYLGGQGDDRGFGIAVDNSGNAYVTGATSSTNFPIAAAIQTSPGGGRDAFVAKLNAAGNSLIFSTYFGGSGQDSGNAIALDSAGNAYVAGDTTSTNLAVLSAVQSSNCGRQDAFVAKLSPTGALVYSTYLGGAGDDHAGGIAVDSTGSAYIAGGTDSTNFPVANPFQSINGGGQDAFVSKLSANGSALLYSTYLGGSGGSAGLPEFAAAIAVDAAGNAYITGVTSSPNFPVLGPLAATLAGGGYDAFVVKLGATGNRLLYGTYLGGTSADSGTAIAVDAGGNAYVTGYTASLDFPTANALQSGNAGGYDAFIVTLNPGGSALTFATYLGGNGADTGAGVAVDGAGGIYVVGQTLSANFPTANALQTSDTGNFGAFVTKLSTNPNQPPQAISVTPASGTGSNQNFQILSMDPNGTADLQTIWVWLTPAFSSPTANSCLLYYNQGGSVINLLNDAGNMWMPMVAGLGGTLQNSQCSIDTGLSTIVSAGNNLTLSLPIAFKAGYAGMQQVWIYVSGGAGNSGWQQRGIWTATAPVPPVNAVSVTPSAGSGSSQTFQFLASDVSGALDVNQVWMWLTPSFNAPIAGSCLLYYNRTSGLYLLNDSGSAWMPPMAPGTVGTLQNSQCSVNVGSTTVTPSGNNLTVSVPITFKPAYIGILQVWMYTGGSISNSGWQQRGTWTATAPTTPVNAVSVTPNMGTGSSQTFQLVASDTSGVTDLQTVWMWFTPAFSSPTANSCLLYYNRSTNMLNLLNDAGNSWMSMGIGSGTLQNNQCSLNAGTTTVTPSGNNLTLSVPVSFKAAYAGNQQVWMYAGGTAGNSGWQQRGTWTATAPPAPVNAVSVTPNSGAGLTQAFQFLASDSNGFTDLQTVWAWFTPAFSSPTANSCLIYYSQTSNQINLLNDAGGTWMSATPGAAGLLQNSQCSLNVAGVTTTASGINLTVSLTMTFKAAYTGAKQVWMYVSGGAGNSGWQQRGTWTAQ